MEKEGATYDTVKQNRLEETTKAAEILGVKNIEFWDLPDYPMRPYLTEDIRKRMVKKIREVRPDIIITHDKKEKTY